MSRILITGGSGFIGTNLVQQCLDEGQEVVSTDMNPPQDPCHTPFFRQADLRDESAIAKVIADFRPSVILHLGARADLDGHTVEDYTANTRGVSHVIKAAKAAGTQRVVFTSSQLACRVGYTPQNDEDYCPPNPYGESKVVGEKIVRSEADDAFEWAIVRPTSIWGPWFNAPYRGFFHTVRAGRYIQPKGRQLPKTFGYVGNTAQQFARLADAPAAKIHRRLFYMADYEPIELADWTRLIQQAWGNPRVYQAPVGILKAIALAGDVAKRAGMKNPPLTSFRLNNVLTPLLHDMKPLQSVCGPMPYTIPQGVELTVEWMRAHNL